MGGPTFPNRDTTWLLPVASPAALPLVGVPGEAHVVLDDGDGSSAVYVWNPVLLMWEKVGDPDFGGGSSDHGLLIGLGDDDHTQYLLATGARAGATSGAQDFGSNGITADVIDESGLNNGVALQGQRHYGSLAAAPSPSGGAVEGDAYYDTVLQCEMRYDGTRAKWLSSYEIVWPFGRNFIGTPSGAFYRMINGQLGSATVGWNPRFDATIVGFAYTRSDSDSAGFEIVDAGTTLTTVASSAVSGEDNSIDEDIAPGSVVTLRNGGPNASSAVEATLYVKWRT